MSADEDEGDWKLWDEVGFRIADASTLKRLLAESDTDDAKRRLLELRAAIVMAFPFLVRP